MIISLRTADIQDGAQETAFAWAVGIAAYVNEHFPGHDVRVARNVGGPVAQVRWIANYDSLAEFERTWQAMEADDGYISMIRDAREQELFFAAGILDEIMQVIA